MSWALGLIVALIRLSSPVTNSTSNLPLESHLLSLVSVELGHMWNEVLDDFSSPLDPTLSGLLEPKYYKHVLVCLGSVSFQPPTPPHHHHCCFLDKIQKQGVGTWEGTIWLSHLFFFIWVSFRLQSVPQLMQTLEAQLISLHFFKVTAPWQANSNCCTELTVR